MTQTGGSINRFQEIDAHIHEFQAIKQDGSILYDHRAKVQDFCETTTNCRQA